MLVREFRMINNDSVASKDGRVYNDFYKIQMAFLLRRWIMSGYDLHRKHCRHFGHFEACTRFYPDYNSF